MNDRIGGVSYIECIHADETGNRIFANLNIKKFKDLYYANLEAIYRAHSRIRDDAEYIWSLLASGRFSIYSNRLQPWLIEEYKRYIRCCIQESEPIHVVLAAFPGKCANKDKASGVKPDLGELSALAALDKLNALVKMRFLPGVKFTFLSDLVGLRMAFFPKLEDIDLYLSEMDSIAENFSTEYKFVRITEIAVDVEEFENDFKGMIPELLKSNEAENLPSRLMGSIRDNMNLGAAMSFYGEMLPSTAGLEDKAVRASTMFYTMFWDWINASMTIENYFGDFIHASPVAYHPDRRLCLKLQSKHSTTLPWNGVAVCTAKSVYSLSERNCKADPELVAVYRNKNSLLGYVSRSCIIDV